MKNNYEIKIKLTPKFTIKSVNKTNVIDYNGVYYCAVDLEKMQNSDALKFIQSLYDCEIIDNIDNINNFKECINSKENYVDFLFEKIYEVLDLGEVESFEIIAKGICDSGGLFSKDIEFSFLSEIRSASEKYQNLKSMIDFGKSPTVSTYTWAPPGCTKMRCRVILESSNKIAAAAVV